MNDELRQFDSIRPFEPEELPEVYERLAADKQFRAVIAYLYPQVPFEAIVMKMRGCKTNLEFQRTFCYTFLEELLAKASTGCNLDASAIDTQRRYTFVSNHRDIVLDSALLDKLLFDAGFTTTCEIAIGDNLLSLPWVKDLVRVNKSFIVERSLQPRQMLMASKRLSEYMHYAIARKNENIWIAQREGRAKDSNDRTQDAVLKMLAMGGDLKELNIVPLTISYEYDPCDYLKAQEFQQKRDNPTFKKSRQDDLDNMKTGIFGYKGRVVYRTAAPINTWIDELSDLPKTEYFKAVAERMDREIHKGYELFPCNYIALDELNGDQANSTHYTDDDKQNFGQYLSGQLAKITLENKDEAFLRERILTMYANPVINYLTAE